MSATFPRLLSARVRRAFWTLNNGRVHMATCQEEGELFGPRWREWKQGCIVLSVWDSFHLSTEHLTLISLDLFLGKLEQWNALEAEVFGFFFFKSRVHNRSYLYLHACI